MKERNTAFKDSSLNSLPEGWKRVRLGEVIEENVKSPFKVEDASEEGPYPFFTSGEIVLRTSRWLIDGEYLFLSTGGSFYVKHYKGKASYSADTWALKGNKNLESGYLFYFLQSKIDHITYKYFIGSGLEHLQKDFFKSDFQVVYPESLPEQRKIAEILETVVNAIEKTDAIIEKYKRIKKGLMEDLLTGKIRLVPNGHSEADGEEAFFGVPNKNWKDSPLGTIPEEWEVKKVGDTFRYRKGKPPNEIISGRDFASLLYLTPEYLRGEAQPLYVLKSKNFVEVPDDKRIILLWDGSNAGEFFKSKRGILSSTMVALDPLDDHLNTDYIYYALKSKEYFLQGQTSGSGIPHVDKEVFKSLLLPLPPLPEQQRIAKVLSQIDEVIEKELNYKEKLERIKKGLMEDLLTGKVRVNSLIKEG